MADPITWPVAFTIVGGIAVTAVTIMGFVIQFFKGDNKLVTVVSKIENRLTKVESEIKGMPEKILNVKKITTDKNLHLEKDLSKLEIKMEKITDLMIKMLTANAPQDLGEKE